MRLVVLKHPKPIWTCHHVEVIQIIAMRRGHGVVAARHHDNIVVFHSAGFVNASVISVNPLEGKALRRIQTVVVGFFQQGFHWRLLHVMLVRRVAGRMAGGRHHLDHQKMVCGWVIMRQNVANIAGIRAFATHTAAHAGGVDHLELALIFFAR